MALRVHAIVSLQRRVTKKIGLLAMLLAVIVIAFLPKKENDLPNIKLYVNEDYLYDSDLGILAGSNRFNKGREWERPALVFYYDKGGLVFKSRAGIRVHGGWSRKYEDPSFRVYFRKRYLSENVKGEKIDSGFEGDISALVVHREKHFMAFVAMPVAKKIGAITPVIVPVAAYLNEEYIGPRFLCEPLKKRFYADHLEVPESNLVFSRMKMAGGGMSAAEKRDFNVREKYRQALLSTDVLTMAGVGTDIDLGNFIPHIFSIIFLGVTDWRQGAMYKLANGSDTWKFVNWDMDHSIYDLAANNNPEISAGRPGWSQEGFELVTLGANWWKSSLEYRALNKYDVRSLLFLRLWMEDEHFRMRFSAFVKKTLNTRITKNYLEKELKKARELAEKFSVSPPVLELAVPFFKCRSHFILHQIEALNSLPLSYSLSETKAYRSLLQETLLKTHDYECDR